MMLSVALLSCSEEISNSLDAPQQPLNLTGQLMQQNVLFTLDGDNYLWTSPTAIYWRDQQTPVDIYGYYPGVNYIGNPTSYSFEVSTDQSTEAHDGELAGYEQSDLLWGKVTNQSFTTDQINVQFHHILAGVHVQLNKGQGISDIEWEKLEKIVMVCNTVLECFKY